MKASQILCYAVLASASRLSIQSTAAEPFSACGTAKVGMHACGKANAVFDRCISSKEK